MVNLHKKTIISQVLFDFMWFSSWNARLWWKLFIVARKQHHGGSARTERAGAGKRGGAGRAGGASPA